MRVVDLTGTRVRSLPELVLNLRKDNIYPVRFLYQRPGGHDQIIEVAGQGKDVHLIYRKGGNPHMASPAACQRLLAYTTDGRDSKRQQRGKPTRKCTGSQRKRGFRNKRLQPHPAPS